MGSRGHMLRRRAIQGSKRTIAVNPQLEKTATCHTLISARAIILTHMNLQATAPAQTSRHSWCDLQWLPNLGIQSILGYQRNLPY